MSVLTWLPHVFEHYARSAIRDASAGQQLQAPLTPTHARVRCFVQPVTSEIKAQYQQRNQTVTKSIFLTDEAVFDAVKTDDRIIFNGHWYVKKGDANLSELDRVYRIDVVSEQGGR